jgi:hypothetical protein
MSYSTFLLVADIVALGSMKEIGHFLGRNAFLSHVHMPYTQKTDI